ncbi:helix-turn-helix domain-containing protein [Nocardia otitidiscaviarum]|uniref:helix-turn-helix transcriptional regulator n=1 Tax=Nocardia otitidiscaviarum TaxID=1823 RepID=UPI0004A6F862|nr:helix-turn-helix transcriptional regulator [Nocardia otitidiscaviarum]MBF6137895.1 helix-turn-helix domain-containing protein [Nocardia otitidiscaviarum]MBF6240031.1 helix-turn-helix domain-containing protein [Nocardia otitidiscaviarum]MBF6488791.1 helix-turn-helix domain-containing protein [Nocardia otitidiscaviarum]
MDRDQLADFLRKRRSVLQPSDVGLAPGNRRRTPGLRRDEVALLAGVSTDYYTRMEQSRAPRPSTQVLAALARALRLTDGERDHLYHLCGHEPPRSGDPHVGPGLLHVLAKLDDTPACVISDLGEVLVQNRMHILLVGDLGDRRGLDRCVPWLWFTDPDDRRKFPEDNWEELSRHHVASLRATAARRSGDAEVIDLIRRLRERSPEFERLWDDHEVSAGTGYVKRLIHPEVGLLELVCEPLLTPSATRHLLVYYPQPGTDTQEKLDLLRVIGTQLMSER